eukprot:TRINITY_DN6197_c0_g1_i1.p1 TRINITY_DN6197_c0_g1~~TRINITY_DN6197_c0_g1_i1.p1  ORF type:complete len:467 (+),score=45.68 TRINITY_DN6197_c0_g1_i1:200-1402(+)
METLRLRHDEEKAGVSRRQGSLPSEPHDRGSALNMDRPAILRIVNHPGHHDQHDVCRRGDPGVTLGSLSLSCLDSTQTAAVPSSSHARSPSQQESTSDAPRSEASLPQGVPIAQSCPQPRADSPSSGTAEQLEVSLAPTNGQLLEDVSVHREVAGRGSIDRNSGSTGQEGNQSSLGIRTSKSKSKGTPKGTPRGVSSSSASRGTPRGKGPKVAPNDASASLGIETSRSIEKREKRRLRQEGTKPSDENEVKGFQPRSFDRVLLDAPCSALGLRPRLFAAEITLEDLRMTSVYQRRLMDEAVQLVKPGGVVVYSTCTINPGENEALVRYALDKYPELILVPQDPHLGGPGLIGGLDVFDGVGSKEWLRKGEEDLVQRFDPCGPHDTIGFFIAKFRMAPRCA